MALPEPSPCCLEALPEPHGEQVEGAQWICDCGQVWVWHSDDGGGWYRRLIEPQL